MIARHSNYHTGRLYGYYYRQPRRDFRVGSGGVWRG